MICVVLFVSLFPISESRALPIFSPCFFQTEEEDPPPTPGFTCSELGLLLLSGPEPVFHHREPMAVESVPGAHKPTVGGVRG